MALLSPIVLLVVFGSALGDFMYEQNVTGLIKDGVPFRILCNLTKAVNPEFHIAIEGFEAGGTRLFLASITTKFPPHNMMVMISGTEVDSQKLPDYQADMDISGQPAVSLVMGYGSGKFFVSSGEKVINASTVSQASDVVTIGMLVLGEITICTQVQVQCDDPP